METAPVRAGVLGQAALALADGFAQILMEKGVMTRAEYLRGFDLAIQTWAEANGHPQQHDVLSALEKIRPLE